ncbi:hypothetical protein [Brevibacterium rongguiense]|nr:hypothetical protein [Brevibacterium rongguiense]
MSAVAIAAGFVWLGMVLAISFLEAPLKFQAPGITIPLGLGIGRLVFRALNACELALAAVVTAGLLLSGGGPGGSWGLGGCALLGAVALLLLQLLLARPLVTRRSDAVLAGQDPGEHRSRAHLLYVAFEVAKAAALGVGAIASMVALAALTG